MLRINGEVVHLTWEKTPTGGYRAETPGAVFTMPANQETVSVTLGDGRTGYGWTEQEAWSCAQATPLPTYDRRKICPLTLASSNDETEWCQQERCAWWNRDFEMCALAALALTQTRPIVREESRR